MVKGMAADLMPALEKALPDPRILVICFEECLPRGEECNLDLGILPEEFFQILQDVHQMAIVVTQRDLGLIPPAMEKCLEGFGFRLICENAWSVYPK